MNKISKDKRDKLILTCLAILGVLGILYTFVLGVQKDQLAALESQITGTKDKLSKAERLERSAAVIEANLKQNQQTLDTLQQGMAPQGQYYYWFLTQLEKFRTEEKLDSISFHEITQPEFTEAALLPKFPYTAASFTVQLSGDFHEVGKFLADLENTFPYFRVQDLHIGLPGMSGLRMVQSPGSRAEKVLVQLKVVTLIKPAA
jgi:Tfp pilus assembly protein PilO